MVRFLILFLIHNLFFAASAQANPSFASRPDVTAFIQQMVKQYKFKQASLIALFNTVKIRSAVIRKIKAPLEKEPWTLYQRLFVTEWRIRKGVEFWNRYQTALAQAEKKYGVPASIIVATIGVETKYGLHTGKFRVIDALSNIAFSNSVRAPFFKNELKEFLLLTREQKLDPMKVSGSYAGAIGQPQFMPSSYRRYAVSYNGHTKIDLANNELDIIASIGNYYKLHGWKTNQPVAMPISLVSHKFQFFLNTKKEVKIISKSALTDEGNMSDNQLLKNNPHKIISLPTYWGNEYWFGFHNFDVIKRYNASDLYAMSVWQLSHYIATLREKLHNA
ncbi:MAG: mltB 2 [Gammaproteobacteria bacterium]|jgi:membrane-bound lytic murein transglycosylase B|nr:mltB 2 [Gammaproteobacteria bacterium]